MTEKEKKAIERIEDTIYTHNGYGINHFKKITLYENGIDDMQTILNLIQNLQEEKEKYKRMLAEIHAQSFNNSIAEKKKHEEQLEALNEGWKIELEKKDNIIDEMARFIADLDIDEDICKHQVAEFCEGTDGVSLDICVKCIKQYFKKASDGDD